MAASYLSAVQQQSFGALAAKEEQKSQSLVVPSYLVATDNHSIANNKESLMDGAIDTASSVATFIGLSMVAGINEVYNIAPTLGNYAGGDFELSKTADVITALDDDLGEYYKEHQEAIDVGGFLISSLVPGTAAIKGLNMGQKALATMKTTGRVGKNFQNAMGFATRGKRQQYLDKAIKEVSSKNTLSLLTNTNTAKAMAAGYGQAVLEMAAFETATAIALGSSPVLEGQDFGDIATNIAVFGLAFGSIGGVYNVTKSAYAVKNARDAAAIAKAPFTQVLSLHPDAPYANKVAFALREIDKINTTPREILEQGVENVSRESLDRAVESQVQFYTNTIRENLTRLAGDDKEMGAAAYAMLVGKEAKSGWQDYLGATQYTRRTEFTKAEAAYDKAKKAVQSGKAVVGSKEAKLIEETTVETSYINVWGESLGINAGKGTKEAPAFTSLSDTLKVNEAIKIDKFGVTVGKRNRFDFEVKNIRLARNNNPRTLGFKTADNRAKAGSGYTVLGKSSQENEARVMWAERLPSFQSVADLKGKAKNARINIGVTIDEGDIALLEKITKDFHPDNTVKLEGKGKGKGELLKFNTQDQMYKFLLDQKSKYSMILARESAAKPAGLGMIHEEIAASVNVTPGWLNAGIRQTDYDRTAYALQGYAEDYAEMLVGRGVNTVIDGKTGKLVTKTAEELVKDSPVYLQPKTIKVVSDSSLTRDVDNNIIEGIAVITQQERLLSQRLETSFAAYMGEDVSKFPPLSKGLMLEAETLGIISTATPSGAGGKLVTSGGLANFGSLGSHMEWIGKATSILKGKKVKEMNDSLNPSSIKLAGSKSASIEWSVLSAKIREFGSQKYVVDPDGLPRLVRRELALYRRQVAEGVEGLTATPPTSVTKGAPDFVPIKNPETLEMVKTHIEVNGKRVRAINENRTARGLDTRVEADEFYPIPPNPRDFKFFAIITDDSVTATGHSKMIYADSQDALDTMLNKLGKRVPIAEGSGVYKADNWKIYTKKDAENYHRSFGQFEQTRTLNDNYMDAAMERKGVSSPFFVKTDPAKIVKDIHDFHTTQETSLVREMVESNYEKEFEYLRQRGREFTNLATSQFNNVASLKHAESVVKNPYMDYIRTALDVKNYADYPFWVNANIQIEKKVSEVMDDIGQLFRDSKSVDDLDEINRLLESSGYKGAAYDAEMELLVNHTAPRSALQNFVQKSNSILATTILRLDFLNAATNAISANILYGAEMSSIIRQINGSGNKLAIGELAGLQGLVVPGTGSSMRSSMKVLGNAYKKFGRDTPDMKFFKDHGFVTTISDQYRSVIDSLTLDGTESAVKLQGKLDKAYKLGKEFVDKGERLTGNRLAEEFNRFVAAHSMKQFTDVAVKNGLMDSREALSYINTFVNRTQGNYLASQRPMLFQGAIGQSIGLFQTYQFNLMQQLLRHMGEGAAKDSATLIGLQGTIFGLNGLPAFNAINTHIIGTASGNEKHRDAYTAVYGAAGKEAGDWAMYGLASNFLLHPDLKTNLYVRGDINPRNVTIVPVDPRNIPMVQAAGKFFGNIWNTASKVANGGDFTTAILQGLEHNGISRPLAGLAQTLEGLANPLKQSYSTSNRGNVIGSNDLFSLVNMGRMLGGKPLGEAVAMDEAFRTKTYSIADSRKRSELGAAIKTTMIAGQDPTAEQIDNFVYEYAAIGGKPEEFNSWMMDLYTTANTSQANVIRRNLSSPYSQRMQEIMAGYELRDFTN